MFFRLLGNCCIFATKNKSVKMQSYNMRQKILSFLLSLSLVGTTWAVQTDDSVFIGDLEVNPGGDQIFFTVSLEGTQLYTAYDIQLVLPRGLEVVYKNGSPLVQMFKGKTGIYPYVEEEDPFEGTTTTTYNHSLTSNVLENNVLRVICFSQNLDEFTAQSGRLFGVYVKPSPYLKPGDVEILIKDVCFVTVDNKEHKFEDYVSTSVKATNSTTFALEVPSTNKFATCILPFNYELPIDGSLEAYTCNSCTDEALVLSEVSRIESYKPYIVYSEMGFRETISGMVDVTNYPSQGVVKSGLLVGTIEQTELMDANCYVMQNQGSGAMFYRIDPTIPFVIPEGKCYVELPSESASAVSFRIGGVSGILDSQLVADEESLEIYNILGMRVEQMVRGHIYIVNGRKVIGK